MNSERQKIAVIGMACRFPGANNINEYWSNLINGKETIKRFEDNELQDYEINYEKLKQNPNFVPARGILDNIDEFDSQFFGMSPLEASLTDPQHRVWLETVWAGFENAGCKPNEYKGNIGVYAGGYANTYILNNVLRDPEKYENYIRLRSTESFQIATTNDITHLPTKTAYQFNLKGPAINVQTACSTSLVAIAQACNSLYSFESDICVAGGVCILVPQESGYLYQEGAIPSPDGRCRPFDERAQGTVFSNGVGVVVLKRIEDAIKDNDHIYAVVDGWALNNDGNKKVSYTAPSVQGQEEVILMAQSFAGITADEIGYVEAHGTATNLGDPIEVKALTNAFSKTTSKKQFCGIGSVKSNIGHTDAAAGVASFIKVCLAAYYKTIPPSLNFEKPNPYIKFEDSPFYVNDKPKIWDEDKRLVIGVSSFGLGGTNAHIILEEPPQSQETVAENKTQDIHVLPLSAKTKASLKQRIKQLSEFLKENNNISLDRISHNLWNSREHMSHRSVLITNSVSKLLDNSFEYVEGKFVEGITNFTFMFPGQGAQFINMGKSLYEESEAFKEIVDKGFAIFRTETGISLEDIIFPEINIEESEKELTNTSITQPAIFIFEYALAKILIEEGISPKYLIGHSIGEYAAAAISGIFDFETGLKVVTKRGQLMQKMPAGKMFAVKASYQRLDKIKANFFEIAAENAPESCTISFESQDIEQVKEILDQEEIRYIQLNTSHAFHSKAFDPILDEFAAFVEKCNPGTPQIPLISCRTGEFITADDAQSGRYWAKQLRNSVLFSKGVSTIQSIENTLFIEVGPNSHLSSNIKSSAVDINSKTSILTLGRPGDNKKEIVTRIKSNIWCCTSTEFKEFSPTDTNSTKIPLPTYPFDKKRFWIEHKADKINTDVNKEDSDHTNKITTDNKLSDVLLSIWKKNFGREDINLNDNFQDLGGESMLAFSLIADIEKLLHIKISFRDFMAEYNTIQKVQTYIENELKVNQPPEKTKFNHIYNIKSGEGIPIFGVFCERIFTKKDMIKSCPIYDFAWPGSDGRPFTMHSVEEIAQAYLDEILKVYANGPFYLIGFSFGGLIAFEIALKLQKLGFKVPVLALIDSQNPQLKITENRVQQYKNKFKEHGFTKILTSRLYSAAKHQFHERFLRIRIYILLKLKRKLPANLTHVMIYNESIKLAQQYHPAYFDGALHLFKSKDNVIEDEFLGWGPLVSGIYTHELEGNHMDTVQQKQNKLTIINELNKVIFKTEK